MVAFNDTRFLAIKEEITDNYFIIPHTVKNKINLQIIMFKLNLNSEWGNIC